MIDVGKDRRKYYRYDTEMKLHFRVHYDIRTKVKFHILNAIKKRILLKRYSGVSKNISAEGLCFVSRKKLTVGDILLLEIYPPKAKKPVLLEGEVRWSHPVSTDPRYKKLCHTGVKLLLADGKAVSGSIFHDKENDVAWSVVLESVFGSFKKMIKSLKEKHKKASG